MPSYLALARKYRPHSFKELVGQDHIVKTLVNALNNQNLHHAFLFTGTRGVGKTSIARIFAKALNCEQKISATPCEKCQSCLEINQGSSLDLIEFDAASHTSVDDMRDILENSRYLPSKSRFKIYLIDEVHMLSTSSFNALLKTLEEPPEHIKFLFATTDPQKLPVTILSRCLSFNLQRISNDVIEKQLSKVLTKEKYPFEKNALAHIAEGAEGSMRDALSLLDQAIAYTNQNLTEKAIITMLGLVPHDDFMKLLTQLLQKDVESLMANIKNMTNRGENLNNLLKNLMHHFHRLSIIKAGINHKDKHLTMLAKQVSQEQLQLLYQIALQGLQDLKYAPNHQIGVEVVLLRMLTFALANEEAKTDANSVETNAKKAEKPTKKKAPN